MAEIDPVILKLRADVDRYQADLRNATRTVDRQLGQQEGRVRRLEGQFRQSSGAISASIKGLIATLATAFTGRELVGLLDSFTRFQNQLKVAGLEGEQLLNVQERLRAIGREYGADLESLGSTFSRIAQVQGDLGASTEQIIQLNQIVAASLKVAGTDAQAASGALLQLGQAFGSGIVRAEEFNSILEGALPLAQAAARGIDGFGGSVAKLRAAIADGQVTSKQFFEGVLRGGIQTIEDAEQATLTLSGAFTALRNEFTVYFGEAGQAAGATEALAGAIQALADNLDTLIPILATIAVGLGVGYVTNAVRARLATVALGTAATATGRALLAAFGGPVGVAITAVAVGLAFVATNAESAQQRIDRLNSSAQTAAREADDMEAKLREAGVAMDNVGIASDTARDGIDGVSGAARTAKGELYALQQQAIRTAVALVDLDITENNRRRVAISRVSNAEVGQTTAGLALRENGNPRQAARDAEIIALDEEFKQLTRKRNAIIAGIVNGVDFGGGAGGDGPPPAPTTTASRPKTITDPAAARRRFDDQLDSIRSRVAAAELSLATSIEERAELELRQVEAALRQSLRALEAEDEYTGAQRKRLRVGLENVAAAEREAIEFQKRADIEQRNRDLAEDRGRAQLDALRIEFDLADTEAERRALALRILQAEQDLLRSRLSSLANSETIDETDRERARIALDALNATAAGEAETVRRQFEGPLARFARNTQDVDTRVQEAAVRRIEQLNETISDAMTNALGIEDPFLRDLIGIFLDRNVFGPLAEALSAQGGSGGLLGGIATAIGTLFGRSSGGAVTAGRAYRVNEGAPAGRVEAFVPNTSGQIIPLGQMNAMQAGGQQSGGIVRVMIEEAPGFAARVRTEATGVALEVTRQTAPTIIDAAASETLRRAQRPTL